MATQKDRGLSQSPSFALV